MRLHGRGIVVRQAGWQPALRAIYLRAMDDLAAWLPEALSQIVRGGGAALAASLMGGNLYHKMIVSGFGEDAKRTKGGQTKQYQGLEMHEISRQAI
jgi:hypothetical protein